MSPGNKHPGGGGCYLSLVIPVYNESESLRLLHEGITAALGGLDYEVIYVDDGSTDATAQRLREICLRDPRVEVIRFGRNFGKSEAMAAGFKEARGEIVVTMDADLQDDPTEVPRMVAELEKGFDLVVGWKQKRHDPLSKTAPSRVFNRVTARLTGLRLHDFNSGFKAYRRQVVESLHVYGEQHRFIAALAHWKGFRVTEIPVRHHARRFGRSKFGAWRFFAGFLDLFTILFLTRFKRKPLHLFGLFGVACLGVGALINLYLTVLWLGGEPIGRRPLLQLGILLMVMGMQFVGIGLLGEMVTLSAAKEETRAYEVLEWPARRATEEASDAPHKPAAADTDRASSAPR
ncbi:MAG: glycosyltransferase family 2 protein [Chloroflexi bacterium]|nr:glycosyltransferase family 2 protein [Chloroflexota bacterium]